MSANNSPSVFHFNGPTNSNHCGAGVGGVRVKGGGGGGGRVNKQL